MKQRPLGTGPARRRSTCENIVQELKRSRSSPSMIVLGSEGGNKGTLHLKRVLKAKVKESDRYRTLPLKHPCQISGHPPFLPKSLV